ncbi:hypothetical protein C1868_02875 [Eggerthella lenta]|uniref:helix-turn-helix transcriptional regulator n=1 Tax=Eggerthella lenta TaxID=84112 RepID=UPI000DF6F23D|nr:helix-turn-helix transcriptional regulator [Eggerthella lenta]RDB94979.1 hypothetical protein C1868_02875 [Eggerthella lenta]
MENTSLKTQLGTNIARLRASANVSQTSFALMVGVSRKYLIDIESGKANPTVDMLERIAGGLDTTVPAVRGSVRGRRYSSTGFQLPSMSHSHASGSRTVKNVSVLSSGPS